MNTSDLNKTQNSGGASSGANKGGATTEKFKKDQQEKWFECNDVTFIKNNLLALRRSREERETNIDAKIYQGFTLLQYACVFDRLDVLRLIYQTEKDSICEQALTIYKNNTNIEIPAQTTPLQLAILCNSIRCTQFLLDQLTKTDVRIPLNEKNETTSLICARLPEYEAAHIALSYELLQTKEFFYETPESENVVLAACKARNEFLMHLFTQLLATANARHIQKFSLSVTAETSAECKAYLKVLQVSALDKVVRERLFEDSDWEQQLKVYYANNKPSNDDSPKNGTEYADEQIQKLRDADEKRQKQEEFMKNYASQRANNNNKGGRVNKLTGQSNANQKYVVSSKPAYDFSNVKTPVDCKKFELQAEIVQIDIQQEEIKEEEKVAEETIEEKFNLFDNKPESQIPILISQYGNCFQISRPEQLAAARNFASDDRVVPLNQAQINWFNVCKEGNLQLVKSMIRTHVNEVDTRATDPEKLIFNGFSGIHYAVVFGRWQVVEHLMTYEALATTKARVILKAPGIGPDRAVIVPLQSNCLQLACYTNQVEIVKLIVDSLIQPKKQIIDNIQLAFSANKPLSQDQQKKLLSLKNELEHTALAVLAQCKTLSQELCKNLDKEDYILQMCLDQLETDDILEYNDQFAIQNAYIFNNGHIIKTLRTELLSNPCKKMKNDVFSLLLFKIYDLVMDMNYGLECKEVLESITIQDDVKLEIETLTQQIQAQWYIDRQKEDEEAELPHNQYQEGLPEEQQFRKHFYETFKEYDEELQHASDGVNEKLEFLKHPKYVEEGFNNEIFQKFESLENEQGDLAYLNSVVQAQDLSYYFDCIILGYTQFVQSECDNFQTSIDRRQTNKQVINGFTGLLYACYYGHLDIVKILLEKEFHIIQKDQIKIVSNPTCTYVFDGLVNALHVAVLSKSENAPKIIDYITQVASQNASIAECLFCNHKKSSDILKLGVIHQSYHVFNNPVVRYYETQHVYKQLQDFPEVPTILYCICKNQSVAGCKFIQDIIMGDSIATRAETDIPQQTKLNIESELLFSMQLACLQRIDGKCPLDWINAKTVTAAGAPVKVSQRDAVQRSICIKLVNDLTNDGIMRALTAQFDELAQMLLEQYYGEKIGEMREQFEQEGDRLSGRVVSKVAEPNPDTVELLARTNFFLEDHQVNRITFQPIQKLNEVDVWFELCKHGTLEQVQQVARNFIGRRELRYNNYELDICQGFTGLMYATLFNSLDVILFLMDHEAMHNLAQDVVVRTKAGAFFIPANCTPLHVAAVGAEQYVIDAYFQFFFEHEYEIVQDISVTRFLIIHDRNVQMDQLIKDFMIDDQLLRLAVQYARVEFLNAMGKMSYTQEYFERFYFQLFNTFEYREHVLTTNDLIWLLPSQNWAKLSKSNVQNTITFVELSVKKVLITLIQQNTLEDNAELIESFFQSPDAVDKVLSSFETLSDPRVVEPEAVRDIAEVQFFRVQEDQICTLEDVTALQMQTELADLWFRACRDNDMQFVHKHFKDMKMSRDGRKQSFINKVHTGFCGLHYAIVYGAKDVFNFLFDFEWNVITGSDAIINGDQGRYYVPSRSTILHLIAMVRNNEFLAQMKVKPQIENLVNAKNKLDMTPIEVFSGQNYCAQYLFDMFLFNFNDSAMRQEAEQILGKCFANCCQENANNYDFAKFSVQNSQLYERLIYRHVFELRIKLAESGDDFEANESIYEFLKLKDDALEYALLYRKEDMWQNLLERLYGSEKDDVEAEYQLLKQLTAEQYELVIEEESVQEPALVVPQSRVREPPKLRFLRESTQSATELRWFEACKSGGPEDLEFIKKNIRLAGIQDQCITNYITRSYTQFTGLMYAIVYGNLDVCKLLAKHELLIYAKAKNLVEVPYDVPPEQSQGEDGEQNQQSQENAVENRYFLTRTCFPVLLAVICHQYEIFDYFVDQLKTQEELIFNQYMYEQMVVCEYQIPYSYMFKLMQSNGSAINYLQLAYITQKDQHMGYLLDFLKSKVDQFDPAAPRHPSELQLIRDYHLDEIIYRQLLSVLTGSNIETWEKIGPCTQQLIDVSINYGLETSYDPEIKIYLINIFGREVAEQEVKKKHNSKFASDLVVDIRQTIRNSYVLNEPDKQVSQETQATYAPSSISDDDIERLGRYFDNVKDNNMAAVKRELFENVGRVECRPYDLENEIFPGFTALHYAVYKNNIPMMGILWNQEKNFATKADVIIEALGTGYGNQYLLSKGSNCLQIAILQDNVEATQMIVNLIQADKNLLKVYERSNAREQNVLYIASVCWRCNSAQIVYSAKFMQVYLRQIVLHKDPRTIPIIDTLMYTNCAYGARILYQWSLTDLQFMQWFYQVVLRYNFYEMRLKHDKQTYGTENDKEFINYWMDQIYEDALNYGLKQNSEINWNRMLEENLGAELKAIILKQYTQYRKVTVSGGKIEILDSVLQQQTVQKVRALEQKNAINGTTMMSNTSMQGDSMMTGGKQSRRIPFNMEKQGQFNSTLNVTTLQDIEEQNLSLPQQKIIQNDQIKLITVDKATQSSPSNKVDNMESLWSEIEKGK